MFSRSRLHVAKIVEGILLHDAYRQHKEFQTMRKR